MVLKTEPLVYPIGLINTTLSVGQKMHLIY